MDVDVEGVDISMIDGAEGSTDGTEGSANGTEGSADGKEGSADGTEGSANGTEGSANGKVVDIDKVVVTVDVDVTGLGGIGIADVVEITDNSTSFTGISSIKFWRLNISLSPVSISSLQMSFTRNHIKIFA